MERSGDQPTDQPPAVATVPGARAGVTASAVQAFGGRLAARFDAVDALIGVGLVLLVAGLWRWWSLGVALSVAGAVVLAIGLMGATARTPQPDGDAEARRGEG